MKTLINKMRLGRKFAVISIGMLLPIGMLAVIAATLEIGSIQTAHLEAVGLDWTAPLMDIAGDIAEYREHSIAIAGGADDERGELQEHAENIRNAVTLLDKLAADSDAKLLEAAGWENLGPRLRSAIEGDGATAKQLLESRLLIEELHEHSRTVAEVSGLTLDPGADSYPLMYASLFALPQGIEALASARRSVDQIAKGDTTVSSFRELAARAAVARLQLDDAMHMLINNYGENATGEAKAAQIAQELQPAVERALKVLDADQQSVLSIENAAAMSTEIEALTEKLAALRDTGAGELASILNERTHTSELKLAAETCVVLGCLLVAFWIQRAVARQIATQIAVANDVFAKLAKGEFDSVIGEQAPDELGALLTSLDSMRVMLAARVEADRQAAERDRERAIASERIKQALDCSSVNLVVADDHHKVIYLNPAAQRLMSSAQQDFKTAQPDFASDRLIGADISVFFPDGARQRELISAQSQVANRQFNVGTRTLVTNINPIVVEGQRIGTVIEWQDRTPEVRAEQEIGELVAAVAEGKLDQRISMNGKTGFFEVLGHGLNGVVGTVSDVVSEMGALVQSANGGDLTQRMKLDGRSGLYVSMGTGVNALVSNLADVVSQVKAKSGEVYLSAEEISKGNTNLSQRTEEQASSLEETASSMEEMTSTVKETADNAGQANQLALAARQQAEKGGTVVGAAVEAMSGINEASKKIADIIGVIDEIAFQTNLLALNAAVEAARAGEQGRGFAVVATEVRSLAGRSATAAKEIKTLIQDSVMRVEEGSKLVNESGRTLVEIVAAVNKVTDIVAEIAAASREQSSGIEQVNKAVMQMDGTTQQNAALVEQAAAASQSIVEQAQALTALVARYQVGESPSSETGKGSVGPTPLLQPVPDRRARDRPWVMKTPAQKARNPASRPARMVSVNGQTDWREF